MVNQKENTKEKILHRLFDAQGQTLSGTKIAEETGISRVAVWKHIKQMITEGVDITSGPSGYALARPEDLLYPFCFPDEFRDLVFHYPEVSTTMDAAKTLARQGVPHMSCCIAENQTQGRGRLNRQWVSSRGGLWFTLIIRPDLPPPMVYIYNFAASLTLARVMNRLFDLKIRVKWPNDLLLEGKKLTGLLSEMETRADLISFLAIGIGINVNNDPTGGSFEAISLKNTLGRELPRRKILSEFLTDFTALTQKIHIPKIMAQWRACTGTIGREVRVETHDKILCGRAVGVEDSGSLIIETPEGQTQEIIYGDCFHA